MNPFEAYDQARLRALQGERDRLAELLADAERRLQTARRQLAEGRPVTGVAP